MLKQFLKIALLIIAITATKFSLDLQSYQKQCFFQILQSQQKYSVDVGSIVFGKYEVEVSNMIEGQWNSIHYKQSTVPHEAISIHKLAPTDSTYSYCFRNIHTERLKLKINIQSGLELMEFQLLPGRSDAENLERELGWLEKEKSKLFQSLGRMETLRATSDGLTNMMSTKMIGFAIVGLISIIVVNVLFYHYLRKTFKQRKLI